MVLQICLPMLPVCFTWQRIFLLLKHCYHSYIIEIAGLLFYFLSFVKIGLVYLTGMIVWLFNISIRKHSQILLFTRWKWLCCNMEVLFLKWYFISFGTIIKHLCYFNIKNMKTIIDIHVLFKFRLLQTHLEPEYWLQSLASARPSDCPSSPNKTKQTNKVQTLLKPKNKKEPESLRAVTIE